jgi:AcrR family transcriptional regulator
LTPSDRHREVLEAALELIAERGYHGASLRELARRLGISQPSLYTYFKSKEELVDQIIRFSGARLFVVLPKEAPPTVLTDVPGYVARMVFQIYENPLYPVFVRFMFAVSMHQPQFRDQLRQMFADMITVGALMLMGPFIDRGETTPDDARHAVRLVTNGIGLGLIEEYVLFGENEPSDKLRRFADFVVEAARLSLGA